MADTKISGLAGAAAFTPSTTQEFPINDAGTSHKVSAAQIAAYFPNGTQGSTWYAQVTANQAGITTETDLTGLTVTVTVGSGRRIRITGYIGCASTVTDDTAQLNIKEGATVLAYWDLLMRPANIGTNCAALAILTPSAGSHTYKLSLVRAAGTGSLTMTGSATSPSFILVEDLGT